MESLDLRKAKVSRGFGNHLVPSHWMIEKTEEDYRKLRLSLGQRIPRGTKGITVSMLGLASFCHVPSRRNRSPFEWLVLARLHIRRLGLAAQAPRQIQCKCCCSWSCRHKPSALFPPPHWASLQHTLRRPGIAWPNGGGVA